MHMKKLMFAVMGLAAVAGDSPGQRASPSTSSRRAASAWPGSLVGAVDDASGIYFNPAGIAQGQGLEVELGSAPIIPSFTVKNPAGTELNGVSNIITPVHLYATWGISDEWTVGLGVFTPYGLKVEWEPEWEGREIIKKADLKIYDINPTAAYRNGRSGSAAASRLSGRRSAHQGHQPARQRLRRGQPRGRRAGASEATSASSTRRSRRSSPSP